jgi:flagellar hook-associated protein 3 FlgL
MVSRVSTSSSVTQFIDQIMRQRKDLNETQDKLSSGKEISDPSDDPGSAGTITSLRNALSRFEQQKKRISYARGLLSHQESTMETSSNIMLRAKEIAAQAANGVYDNEVRAQLAEEVFELRDALVDQANTRYQGRYIYGGLDDDDPPFGTSSTPYTNPATAAATDAVRQRYVFDNVATELGQTTTRTVQISDTDSVQVTTAGTTFEEGIATLERLGRALSGYRSTPEDLSAYPDGGGVAFNFPQELDAQRAVIQGLLTPLENSRQTLVSERSNLGARINRLDQAEEFIKNITLSTEQARSELQDVDVYEMASLFQQQQTSLQATLASGTRLNNLSILDYI